MRTHSFIARATGAASIAALLLAPVMAQAQQSSSRQRAGVAELPVGSERPTRQVLLSTGEGELITLPQPVTSVWTSNPDAADVYVSNQRQIYLFGKNFGEATVFATTAGGKVVYSTKVLVSQNITSVDKMLKVAMPDADIKVTTVGQIAVLTGTVATPDDVAQAQRLVTAILNPGIDASSPTAQLKMGVINRLRTATPLQVNLQVRFAEVSRSFVKNIGSNLLTRDTTGGFLFSVASGRNPGTITTDSTTGATNYTFTSGSQRSTIGMAGKLLGLNVLQALDLGERTGQVTTLSQPNLTALSGETATFLAGGEIPIPISQGYGAVSVEYKQYGVSLAFTPTVLSDGRISMRVRPEVSQLSAAGAVELNGTTIPALTTRRAETSVELGSGESFMIAGLLSNSHDNSFDKTPGVGDMPVLGALFRSNAFQRNETELVIVITPYLVKPVNASEIALPTDGYRAPDDAQRLLGGALTGSKPGGGVDPRPTPRMANPDAQPAVGAFNPVPQQPGQPAVQQAIVPQPQPEQPAPRQDVPQPAKATVPSKPQEKKKTVASAAPGFGQ
ncbi:type II and III secretion system protein family protein [Sphingomonas sp.]|uniref:type II and III secretion system protein family protein n=1 Tax=Sphingomonas sp. TaxID=28214 RepID=UPI001B0AA96F|nr:type II and III secretion system protein family protein [Sphingomonas sp.]MBO9711345.1 type II and III secretion system protein family protein [Sphingomonas sp.]